VGRFAATGEWNLDYYQRLADQIRTGPHASVLDLGSGRSPLLQHLQPERYIGLDLHEPDLEYAKRRYGRDGYEFAEADVLEAPLERWHGVDVVTCSSFFHHLGDEQCVDLMERIERELSPKRYAFADGVLRGPFAGVLSRADYGSPTREPEELYELFRPRFEVAERWSYLVPLRTFRLFGFELKPAPT
jgi:SAM-dependent methyltransferase